ALGLTKAQPVAPGEPRCFGLVAAKLVDHVAFGDLDVSDSHREAKLLRRDFNRCLAIADLPGKRVIAAIATLGGVAQRQQKAFVTPGQRLQPNAAISRVAER